MHGFGGKRRSTASPRRTGRRRAATAPDSTAKRASTPFFDETSLSRRKIPAAEWTRSAAGTEGAEAGVCFFGPCFFARAKKSFFNNRMAGQRGSRPEGKRKPLILLPPLLGRPKAGQSGDRKNRAQAIAGKSNGQIQRQRMKAGCLKAELSLLLRRSELLPFARAKRSNQEKRFSNSPMAGQARAGPRSVGLRPPVPCAPRGTGERRTTRFAQTRAPLRRLSRCGARLALRPGKVRSREQRQQPPASSPRPAPNLTHVKAPLAAG